MVKFSGNAESSEVKPRYDLVPPAAVRYIAERMARGAQTRLDPKGYLTGDYAFVLDRRNHAFEHVLNYVTGATTNGDTPLDHLKAGLAGLAMLAELEERGVELPLEEPTAAADEEKPPLLEALKNWLNASNHVG